MMARARTRRAAKQVSRFHHPHTIFSTSNLVCLPAFSPATPFPTTKQSTASTTAVAFRVIPPRTHLSSSSSPSQHSKRSRHNPIPSLACCRPHFPRSHESDQSPTSLEAFSCRKLAGVRQRCATYKSILTSGTYQHTDYLLLPWSYIDICQNVG